MADGVNTPLSNSTMLDVHFPCASWSNTILREGGREREGGEGGREGWREGVGGREGGSE